MNITEKLQEIEMKSQPVFKNGFLIPRKTVEVVNGHTVIADSKMNRGKSGKGFTTLWYVDGKRVVKKDLIATLSV